jgi:hypothetical protein
VTRELLPRRVINVLNIDENGNGFQFALAHGIDDREQYSAAIAYPNGITTGVF